MTHAIENKHFSPFANPFWKKLDLSINWTMGGMKKLNVWLSYTLDHTPNATLF